MKLYSSFLIVCTLVFSSVFLFAEPPKAEQDIPQEVEDPSSPDSLLKITDKIAERVAKIRGLEIKEKIKRGIKDKSTLRATLVEKLAEDISDKELESEARVFKKMKLIPEDLDYKKMLLDVLTEQVAGFYDPKAKELYVMTGVPLALQKPAMAHELFHAIQDQHFNLTRLQGPFSPMENADFSMARSALIEGDATVLMYDFAMNSPPGTTIADNPAITKLMSSLNFESIMAMESIAGKSEGGPSLGKSALATAPMVFRESLIFPYFQGMNFVVEVKRGRSWAQFNDVYANPPVSTEQIIHPEKYFEGDVPVLLAFDASLPNYQPEFDSTWGEFQWSVFFRSHGLSTERAQKAAAGWDGDRIVSLVHDEKTVVIAATVWDSIEDANAFYEEFKTVLIQKFDVKKPFDEKGKHGRSVCFKNEKGTERLYLEQWGDLVLFIVGAPSNIEKGIEKDASLYTLRDEIWNSFERKDFYKTYDRLRAKNKK